MVGTNANGITDGPIGLASFFAGPARNQGVFKEQKLDPRIQESFDGFSRSIDDGLAFYIETCIQDHLASGGFSNRLQKSVKLSVVRRRNSLNPRRPIYVSDGRQSSAVLREDIHSRNHVGEFGMRRDIKPFVYFAQSDGRGKGTESFTHFDHSVDSITHFQMPRIG